jgi:hypothetical protein
MPAMITFSQSETGGMPETEMQQRDAAFPILRLSQPGDIVDAIRSVATGSL